MNQPPASPGPFGQLPSEFRLPAGRKRLVVALLSVLVVVFTAIVFLLVGRLLGLTLALIVAVIVAAGLFVGMLVAMRSGRPRSTVRFFTFGVQLDDGRGFRLQLVWPDVTAIDLAENWLVDPRGFGGRSGTGPRSLGLVGWGRCEVPNEIPTWLRDYLANLPTDSERGRMFVAIPLGAIDPRWWDGPMGEWVRRHRPDLTPPRPESGDRSAYEPPPHGDPNG